MRSSKTREEYVDEILYAFETAIRHVVKIHLVVTDEDLDQALFEVAKARKVLVTELLER